MSEPAGAGEEPSGRGGRRRLIRWGVTAVVVAAVGWFFARTLAENADELLAQDIGFSWWWVLATVLFALAVPVTGLSWGRIVRVLDPKARVSAVEAIAVQCLSWVLKYIPGQVGSVASKVLWARKKGISRTLVVITFIYENVFLQLASIVPAVVILFASLGPRFFGDNLTLVIAVLLVLVPLVAILYAPLFHRIVALPARRLLKREVPREHFLTSGEALRSSIAFLGPRIINGVGFVLIAHTVSDIGPGEWLPFAAAYALAGAIGILAFLVPGGIGVREGVLAVVLTPYIPLAEAVLIALIARVLATIADALVAAIYLIARRTIPKEIRP